MIFFTRILAFFLLATTLYSCRGTYEVTISAGHDPSEKGKGNFLQKTNGSVTQLRDTIDVGFGIDNSKKLNTLTIDGEKIATRGLSAFQLNGDYYKEYKKHQFVRRVYNGPLSVYTSTYFVASTYGSNLHTDYFIEKKGVNNGRLYMLDQTGKQEPLGRYFKDYKPSADLMSQYYAARPVNRIVRFTALGLWLSSIPMILIGEHNSPLRNVGIWNASLGAAYVPVTCLAVGRKNWSRPFLATQLYIDNYLSPLSPSGIRDTANLPSAEAKTNTTARPGTESIHGSKSEGRDFLVVNNNLIVADSGTQVASANNKKFTINGNSYTDGVTAFQQNGLYFRKFPDIKDQYEFAQRQIDGKISVYSLIRQWERPSQFKLSNDYYYFNPAAFRNTYFVKNDSSYIKNFKRLKPFFADRADVAAMYSNYLKNYWSFRAIAVTENLAYTAAATYFLLQVLRGDLRTNPTRTVVTGAVAVGIAYFAKRYQKTQLKKLRTQFLQTLDIYNRDSK